MDQEVMGDSIWCLLIDRIDVGRAGLQDRRPSSSITAIFGMFELLGTFSAAVTADDWEQCNRMLPTKQRE
jgi:hypothetical protein